MSKPTQPITLYAKSDNTFIIKSYVDTQKTFSFILQHFIHTSFFTHSLYTPLFSPHFDSMSMLKKKFTSKGGVNVVKKLIQKAKP